tara:strand:- start:1775 stop:2050 length:276 start_codon:yes stop_codon:yes gene_type:complete
MGAYKKKNWWFGNQNNNRLIDLPDHFILLFLMKHRNARSDFQAAYDLLDAERQEEILELIEANPYVKKAKWIDEREWHDRLQKRQIRGGSE